MRRLPRAPRSTLKDLKKAASDVFYRRYVSPEIKEKRRSICASCPHWQKSLNRCTQCGCQMRVKTALASSSCPLGKWDAHFAMRE